MPYMTFGQPLFFQKGIFFVVKAGILRCIVQTDNSPYDRATDESRNQQGPKASPIIVLESGNFSHLSYGPRAMLRGPFKKPIAKY